MPAFNSSKQVSTIPQSTLITHCTAQGFKVAVSPVCVGQQNPILCPFVPRSYINELCLSGPGYKVPRCADEPFELIWCPIDGNTGELTKSRAIVPAHRAGWEIRYVQRCFLSLPKGDRLPGADAIRNSRARRLTSVGPCQGTVDRRAIKSQFLQPPHVGVKVVTDLKMQLLETQLLHALAHSGQAAPQPVLPHMLNNLTRIEDCKDLCSLDSEVIRLAEIVFSTVVGHIFKILD